MLRTENLRAGYNGSDALHSVSVQVARGTIVSVVGANGAGKSTLINTVSRLVAANAGAIFFENEAIVPLKPADVVERGIVQVPEGRQLFAPLTVSENLRLGFHRLAKRKDSGALYQQRLDYVLSLFPILRERAQQRAGTMSGGEQQMLAIGRALMADPKLLMLDEPSLGLAPMVVEKIFEILSMLRKDGLTILLVEQHADEALRLADYGYIMSVGRVRAEGPGNELRGHPALQSSYLGKPSSDLSGGVSHHSTSTLTAKVDHVMTENKSFDAVAHGTAMRAAGYWADTTFEDVFAKAVIAHPSKTAVIADRADRQRRRFTYLELDDLVTRAAASLGQLGISRGDIVGVQLPNWWEFVVMALACGRIGAVVNPLMPIFRERELEYMLGFAEAKMLVVPKMFRGFDHEVMAASLRPKLPHLRHVVVVDGAGDNSFDASLLGAPPAPAAMSAAVVRRRDETAVLMYTSGTTGSPKGAMHTTNTLMACADNMAARLGLTPSDVLLICSPLGHMTGYAAGVLLGLRLGATLVLQDIWDARRGTALMAEEGITYAAGATPFLADILEAVAAGAPRPTALRRFLCAGAPIPPVLINRASAELDLTVCSVWGMTEALAGTMTEPATARQKSAATDGHALTGMAVRVLDAKGAPASPGETGRLFVRGSQMFVGYFKRPDLVTFDADGWFDTGDLAYMDTEGYIRINGRTKDVIIRGGENVPVAEIENLLVAHPAILAAAVVGYPDARLGERGCAFVVLRPDQNFDLAALQAYLAECKMAKQYWPERVVVATELPRTPSGKVQKFVLKDEASKFASP